MRGYDPALADLTSGCPMTRSPSPRKTPGTWAGRVSVPRRRLCLSAVFVCLISTMAGCGSSNGLSLGKVSGKVTYKGEPIRQGTVTFQPDDSKGTQGPPALGIIGNDGDFLMTTEQSGDGAIVGFHKVGVLALGQTPVSSPGDAAAGEKDEVKAFLARKSAQASRSTKPEPRKSDSPTYRDPSGKVYPILVPEKLTKPAESGIQVKIDPGANRVNIVIQDNGTVSIEK